LNQKIDNIKIEMIKHSEEETPPIPSQEEPPATEDTEQTSDPENPSTEEEKKEIVLPNPEIFEEETSWLCCTTYKDKARFKTILQHLDLTPVQKEIIKTRYLDLLQGLQKRVRNHSIVFFMGHFIITVGSLFVPALLSIQNSDKEYALIGGPFNVHIYWATFTISLLVTIWNGILTLFRIDKKYYFLNTILESLRSEGWQYMSLTGRYSGHLIRNKKPTHKNQFIHFTHYVEKIKMKQIEEEYYRTDDKAQAPNTTGHTSSRPSAPPTVPTNQVVYPVGMVDLYPQSLDKPLSIMAHQAMPDTVKNVMDTLTQQSAIKRTPPSTPKPTNKSEYVSPYPLTSSLPFSAVSPYRVPTSSTPYSASSPALTTVMSSVRPTLEQTVRDKHPHLFRQVNRPEDAPSAHRPL
jgi:hypothetical protein